MGRQRCSGARGPSLMEAVVQQTSSKRWTSTVIPGHVGSGFMTDGIERPLELKQKCSSAPGPVIVVARPGWDG